MKKHKVGIDFDGTLTEKEVYEFVQELISKGYTPYIVTFRYNDEESKKYMHKNALDYYIELNGSVNGDLRKIAKELSISEDRIIFTNYTDKDVFYEKNTDFLFHLDDQTDQVSAANRAGVPGILYNNDFDWKGKCIKLLENNENLS